MDKKSPVNFICLESNQLEVNAQSSDYKNSLALIQRSKWSWFRVNFFADAAVQFLCRAKDAIGDAWDSDRSTQCIKPSGNHAAQQRRA